MCARASRPTFGLHPEGGTELKQTLAITAAIVVLVALTATGALYGLNALAGSPNKEVKQFAIERSRMVAQFLQQQQQQLAQAQARK